MKRSEAIKTIELLIGRVFDIHPREIEISNCANLILITLEREGMLPPPNGIFNHLNPLTKGEYKWNEEDD